MHELETDKKIKKGKFAWKAEFEKMYRDKDDEFGFDLDIFFKAEFFSRFMYEDYFKVEAVGIENIPSNGPVIFIGNHSGVLPIDCFMFSNAYFNKHHAPRRLRPLVHDSLFSVPGAGKVLRGAGGVPARYEVATKLLNNNETVFFYPEGPRGTGKKYWQRYRLRDFDSGFVKSAIETRACIVPVTTVGGDEIYPMLANLKPIAKIMRMPYWPITPTYPLLPFTWSCMPLPVRLLIKVGAPICFNYPVEAAEDHELRHELTSKVQYQVQAQLNKLLAVRKGPFSKWDLDAVK